MERSQTNEEKNISMFLEAYCSSKNVDKDLSRINIFTQLSTFTHRLNAITFTDFFIYHIIKNEKGYVLLKNKKKYSFEILSDKIENKNDKEYLLDSKNRRKRVIDRTLKLACSNDLANANFMFASTSSGLMFLIEYEKNQEKYIIDYANNIIMKKDEYNELYKLKEISRMDQATLYKIYFLFQEYLPVSFNPFYLFLCPNEILNDLSKIKECNWLNKKYAHNGVHKNNYFWLGDSCDCLFFNDEDYKVNPIYDEIIRFTENPICDNVAFFFDKKINYYYYVNGNQKIYFRLLSDYINDNNIKKQLLSAERYGECHSNSVKILFSLDVHNAKKYLVNGKIKVNEKDYFYHSWVELLKDDKKTVVFDYNSNLIIDKEDYFKLLGAVSINKTESDTLKQEIELLRDFELDFHPLTFGYFSQEIKRDLEKNKFLIKKEAE